MPRLRERDAINDCIIQLVFVFHFFEQGCGDQLPQKININCAREVQ